MKSISRIPFWLWLLILTILCYAVWNPSGHSFFHMLIGDQAAGSTKLLLGIILIIIFGIFGKATASSLGKWGLILYAVLVGAVLFFLYDHDVLNKDNAGSLKYIAPFLVALLLAVGSQGAKIYRAITGTGQVHIDGEVSHEQDIDLEDHHH